MRTYTTSSTAADVAPEAPIIETPVRTVAERVLENIAAGLFAAMLSVAVAWALEMPFESYQWPLVIGLFWAGLLGVVRFSLDEAQLILTAARNAYLVESLRHTTATHQRTLDELRQTRDDLARAQNTLFIKQRGVERVIEREPVADAALQRAQTLVKLKYADGAKVSRRFMADHPAFKWSESDYESAIAILRNAQVFVGREWARFASSEEALARLQIPAAPLPPAAP